MKFILHIGAAKTGSTALQAALANARKALKKEGVWYPLVEKNVPRRQNILATPFQKKTQRVYADRTFGGKTAAEFAMAAWSRIAEQAKNYDTVIISSEHLGGVAKIGDFGAFFKSKFPNVDVQVIYYLRRPSKHTASRIQQRVAANHILESFRPANYFTITKAWKDIFPVELREFSPNTLHGGGIASDFAQAVGLKTSLTEVRLNESLSAEAMQILQDYRRMYYSDKPNKFIPDVDELKSLFKRMTSEKGRKGVLRTDIAETIDRIDFVHKLKEQYGFQFDGLDYTTGPVSKETLDAVFEGTQVRDYMVLDEERLRDLQLEILHAVFADKLLKR